MATGDEGTCSECEHLWSEHDLYGCWRFKCPCTCIDSHWRFDKATRRAVDR